MGADMDLETARFYLMALQLQNMENIELIYRRDEEIETMTVDLEQVRNRLKKCLEI